jgi:DNA invertase Pin-like site-specific DNA recombinase
MADKGQRVGYARVSCVDQNADRQLEQLHADKVFIDQASGRDTERPQLRALLAYVREGDTIVVHSMDRLARNVDDLRRIVQEQSKRGIRVQFLKEHLTFTGEDSPMANLMLSILGSIAQFERDLIKEGQREGIALAKQRGAYRGRKRALSTEKLDELCRRVEAGEKKARLAREFGISRQTLYESLRRTGGYRDQTAASTAKSTTVEASRRHSAFDERL